MSQYTYLTQAFIDEGVVPEDAEILKSVDMILDIKLEKDDSWKKTLRYKTYLEYANDCWGHSQWHYRINGKGNVVGLYIWHSELYLLEKFPEKICSLTQLEELVLRNNRIKQIPNSIGNLASLKYLDLSRNLIKTIPKSIGMLKSLEVLYLSHNQIQTISESILESILSIK